jgi:hypothetical protein
LLEVVIRVESSERREVLEGGDVRLIMASLTKSLGSGDNRTGKAFEEFKLGGAEGIGLDAETRFGAARRKGVIEVSTLMTDDDCAVLSGDIKGGTGGSGS